MIEQALTFGPQGGLVGVLTLPASAPPSSIAFLLFNAGVLPRIGPHRMNVKLARSLAERGHACLRFDMAGQGDSRRAESATDFRTQAVLDIRSAMDCLERDHAVRRFALIGVCSGAAAAFNAALADPRVVGILMFDGYWYRSRWTTLVRCWKTLRAHSWPRVADGLWRRTTALVRRRAATGPVGLFDPSVAPANPPRDVFVRGVRTLVDRGVDQLFIYGGSVLAYYSYADQFRDAFRGEAFLASVRCEYHPEIDHTFASLDAQRRMLSRVGAWADGLASARDP